MRSKISFSHITQKIKGLEHKLISAANINMAIAHILSYGRPL